LNTDEIIVFLSTLHPSLQSYLINSRTVEELLELKDNCSSVKVFEKRFFHLLNAFWILKYLNFTHETYFNRADLRTEPIILLQLIGIQVENNILIENLLEIFRDLDKKVDNCI
jgi:hypothetical protein